MVSHGIKLSQKQRKMIALAAKDNGSVASSMEPTSLVTAPPPPTKVAKLGNAWYVINQISILFLWRVSTLNRQTVLFVSTFGSNLEIERG